MQPRSMRRKTFRMSASRSPAAGADRAGGARAGFTPELFGAPLVDGDVLETKVYKKGDNTYYQWYMKPHRLVTATATGNRVFLLAASANSRQYRRGAEHLQLIADSFYVPPAKNYNMGF
jgi:hypothetical protein